MTPSSPPLQAFAARRERAANVLDALTATARPLGAATARFVEPLQAGADRLRQGRFVVLLIGCFSSGKSSVLNALLGQSVLPVKVNPCTAILTELRYGAHPSVQVHHHHGESQTLDPADFLHTYQIQTPGPSDAQPDRFADIDRAVVRWPLPLLRDGVALIDTPGLDDDPARTARTLRSLPEADAVIFVLNATRFLTELERTTLTRELLPLGLNNLFFPVTMNDLIDKLSQQPEQDRRALRARAARVLDPLCEVEGHGRFDQRFFLLDARGALRARATGDTPRDPVDAEALARSGFPPFEASLEHFLVHERGRAQLLRGLALAERILAGIERQEALDRATAQASVAELRARHEALTPQLAALSQVAERVAESVDRFIELQAEQTWQGLRATLAEAEAELPQAVADLDLGAIAGLDLLTPTGRARVERTLHEQVQGWLEERLGAWQDSLHAQLESALRDLRAQLAAEAHDFSALSQRIVTDFAGGAVRVPLTEILGDEPDPLERWFSVALGAALLSPGTMAAGWAQGYEGALKGAASRLAVRVAVLALGVFLGPIGWAGLALYAVSDAALLVLTGGGQLRRLRRQVAENLQGKLVAQADQVHDDLTTRVREGLQPVRDALVGAAHAEADGLRDALREAIAAREQAVADAADRAQTWRASLAAFQEGVDALREVIGPDPRRTPKRTLRFEPGSIPDALQREHDLKPGTWGLLRVTHGAVTFIDAAGERTELTTGDIHLIPPIAPHHLHADEHAGIEIQLFDAPPALDDDAPRDD